MRKAEHLPSNAHKVPTESLRPHHHPNERDKKIVDKIYRERYKRCAEVLHYMPERDGMKVSLSSVKRTLKRYGMTRYSKFKKWHQYPPRPIPEKPCILVQIDTIHRIVGSLYVYTLLDVNSRWACTDVFEKIGAGRSVEFVRNRKTELPFLIRTLQSDHGSEFSKWFTKQMAADGIQHRHSHVRRPTDNGHVERWNRTLQEECLDRIPQDIQSYKKEIPEYLYWYNTKRPHMGLGMKSPRDILWECSQGID